MKHLLAFCLLIPWLVWAQSGSRTDDPRRAAALQTIPRAQGTHVDPSGRTIVVTDKCLLVDGRPVVPVMGEVHYSRIPANEWADVLRTMKEGGVSIVATYVFWNHHEWTRGAYDFSGDRDLSRFLAEVKKAGLWAVVRLGPWAHGEAREGGFPDWLIDEAVAQAVSFSIRTDTASRSKPTCRVLAPSQRLETARSPSTSCSREIPRSSSRRGHWRLEALRSSRLRRPYLRWMARLLR